MKFTLEIATANYAASAAAVAAGADRIELCSALSEGGLTPSHGYLLQCRKDFSLPMFPIIRPRGGDFLYSGQEYDIIKHDVDFCRQCGFEGIVTGFLLDDGSIDEARIKKIVELAGPMQVTFHRAFDRCAEPFKALQILIDAGCKRILTSGRQLTATEGADLIAQLVEAANDRIIIMPGSGVRQNNIAELATKTRAIEWHSSAGSSTKSPMRYVNTAFKSEKGEYTKESISTEEIYGMKEALTLIAQKQ